jgi:hypothetical protein
MVLCSNRYWILVSGYRIKKSFFDSSSIEHPVSSIGSLQVIEYLSPTFPFEEGLR